MTYIPAANLQVPFWDAYGHSFFAGTAGGFDNTDRMDGALRAALGIEWSDFRNFCVGGAKLTYTIASNGGYPQFLNQITKPARTAWPYAAGDAGGCFLVWGVNDIGNTPVANLPSYVQTYPHCLRAAISRFRSSVIHYITNATRWTSFGTNFSTVAPTVGATSTGDYSSGSIKKVTVIDSAGTSTATYTVPTDWTGGVIGFGLISTSGTAGGTWTWGGTVTSYIDVLLGTNGNGSTTYTGGNAAVGGQTLAFGYVCRRFTVPASGAGLTITLKLTQVDASGSAAIDAAWLEAYNPGPVIVLNCPRPLLIGYQGYSQNTNWSGAVSVTSPNADVAALNVIMAGVVAEFDSMVQLANLDGALNQNNSLPTGVTSLYFSDGLHPNEYGNAKCCDAIIAAVQLCRPSIPLGESAQFATPNSRSGPRRRPILTGQYHLPECASLSSSTLYSCAAGDVFAIPFALTEMRILPVTFACQQSNAPATSGSNIRWGVYNDPNWIGYPQGLVFEVHAAAALALGTTAGVKTQNPPVRPLDPGLYWIVFKVDSLGTTVSQLFTIVGPSPYLPAWQAAGGITSAMAWKLTGQAAGSFASLMANFPTGAVLASTVPLVSIAF